MIIIDARSDTLRVMADTHRIVFGGYSYLQFDNGYSFVIVNIDSFRLRNEYAVQLLNSIEEVKSEKEGVESRVCDYCTVRKGQDLITIGNHEGKYREYVVISIYEVEALNRALKMMIELKKKEKDSPYRLMQIKSAAGIYNEVCGE